MESPRQLKIGKVIQQELAKLLQGSIRAHGISNLMISVTKANVSVDLSIAKVYLSIFPSKEANNYLENIKSNTVAIRHDLAQKIKNQLRRVPELHFYLDDSLDYIETIDTALKAEKNPIRDTESLAKRQKK